MCDGRRSQRSFPVSTNAQNGSLGQESLHTYSAETSCNEKASVPFRTTQVIPCQIITHSRVIRKKKSATHVAIAKKKYYFFVKLKPFITFYAFSNFYVVLCTLVRFGRAPHQTLSEFMDFKKARYPQKTPRDFFISSGKGKGHSTEGNLSFQIYVQEGFNTHSQRKRGSILVLSLSVSDNGVHGGTKSLRFRQHHVEAEDHFERWLLTREVSFIFFSGRKTRIDPRSVPNASSKWNDRRTTREEITFFSKSTQK